MNVKSVSPKKKIARKRFKNRFAYYTNLISCGVIRGQAKIDIHTKIGVSAAAEPLKPVYSRKRMHQVESEEDEVSSDDESLTHPPLETMIHVENPSNGSHLSENSFPTKRVIYFVSTDTYFFYRFQLESAGHLPKLVLTCYRLLWKTPLCIMCVIVKIQ